MGWFTVERISAFLRLVSLIAALRSGGQAVQGYQVVAARPAGVASATSDDANLVGKNVGLSALLAFVAANKRMIESVLKTLGVPAGSAALAGAVIDAGRLTDYWRLFAKATTAAERDEIRTAASRVNDELFDSLFPLEKTEAAK